MTDCDCIVACVSDGPSYCGGGSWLARASSISEYDYYWIDESFKYCPLCGQKVDWGFIEGRLDMQKVVRGGH